MDIDNKFDTHTHTHTHTHTDTHTQEFMWDASSSSSESECDRTEEFDVWKHTLDVPTGDATPVLSFLGLDWKNVTSVDLFVLLESFLSPMKNLSALSTSGRVLSVSIYPSDFGSKQMKIEETHGPQLINENGDSKGVCEDVSLRLYQRQCARYYFAVAVCVDVNSAVELYDLLDGLEVDFAVDCLDIRYVPTGTEIPPPPKSTTTRVPAGYKSPSVFSSALRHSKAKCDWDETPAARSKLLKKKFTNKELYDDDLKVFLASTDEDTDNDTHTHTHTHTH
eukprot:GHVR01143684.1.p1 GENE.GHVR01143684.1~~GHVR01143684.1.p1  ORF type:complete len:289 (+),score=123.68 GHVR01143684.1:33-869(+)